MIFIIKKHLGYGLLISFVYYAVNLLMAFVTMLFNYAYHDKMYSTPGAVKNPKFAICFFIVICIMLAVILFAFFFIGRRFDYEKDNILLSFILLISPNIVIQLLVYITYSMELMWLLNWFSNALGNAFFSETQTAYNLSYSYSVNSLLTYLPFVFAFLGGLSVRNKKIKEFNANNI